MSDTEIRKLLPVLACPRCQKKLNARGDSLECSSCSVLYPIVIGIADLRPNPQEQATESLTWQSHWSEDKQNSLPQKFFSFYRKTVFARAVRSYFDRCFPSEGIFLEAGSGTSETSMRITPKTCDRILVALDIVRPVLERCHPVMDIRICGDIFHLPFYNSSLDGIWNVGVMEHFAPERVTRILSEFNRVLKPGGAVLLLWPGVSSIPQKITAVVEKLINAGKARATVNFHPAEINQLKSLKQGEELLCGSGFQVSRLYHGARSLWAFKILAGTKRIIH